MKPKKGISYLVEVCGIDHSAPSIAKFLLETSGLDKRSVGEFIGEGDDFNKKVRYATRNMPPLSPACDSPWTVASTHGP